MAKQQNKKPMVSVVSPVFECEEYLPQFIESIQGQTLREWELILVDDGSEDGSLAVAQRYAEKDGRITCIAAEHANAGNARNIGMEKATGEYICFLDSDDFCKPEMLEKMYAAAREKNADMVLCQSESYSQKDGSVKPMGWSLVAKNIPETADGCYNGEVCSGYLFQSTIISPWNKMMRLQMLRDNHIKAQSQIAANDVVLSCTALACAERIYPLFESLYVQRRDNPRSITGKLDTDEKHLCGYTASLGLLEELRRLGKYEALKETYQRLAMHNCVWYLEKTKGDAELFNADYLFLQNEGFARLGLLETHPGITFGASNKDGKTFITVRDQPLYEYYRIQAGYQRKKRAEAEETIRKIRASKSYRLGNMLMAGPRKLRGAYRRLKNAHPIQKARMRTRYASAPQRIAFFAMESFHYDVVENMMRICNPEQNYLIAYVHSKAKPEICQMLGELSRKVEWHTYGEPGLKGLPKGKHSNGDLLRRFIQDAKSREKLNWVILPSPEYHPDWYMGLVEEQNRKYKVIAGVHNLNTVFASGDGNEDVRALFKRADEYGVISSTLQATMEENGWADHSVRVFPQIYSPGTPHKTPEEAERVTFVITGIVERERKDYQSVVDALKGIPELHSRLRLVLLGKADNSYAQEIVAQLAEMEKTGLEAVTYSGYVPAEAFNKAMAQADYLLGPIVIETENKGVAEYYGKTKISGIVGDIIRYARPAVVIGDLNLPEELKDSVIAYGSTEELAAAFGSLADRSVLTDYCARAQKNSEKFMLKYHVWNG